MKPAWLIGLLVAMRGCIGYTVYQRRFEVRRKGRLFFCALALGAMSYRLTQLETVAVQQTLDVCILLTLAFGFVFDALEGREKDGA
ncbi:MAG: hypothetical protein QGH25_23585 [Candidatus Latescibacteria bacterium]|nr:hypothetical protein [Candidatus Latescibacterota bacterium]